MGECFIMRRGGNILKLPVPNAAYPRDLAVAVNDGQPQSAIFECFISDAGNPDFYTYQWYLDGIPVDGAISSTFTMENILESAVHMVYCAISNKAGTINTRSATLSAVRNDSPVLDTAYPADVSCDVAGAAVFEVKIIKHGTSSEYTYQWYLDDVAVESATQATFTVTKPAFGKHRVYCEITSPAGITKSRVAMLNVDTAILYAAGANYDDITGGWVYRFTYEGGEVWQDDICKSTRNAIDLTNFSKLYFEGRMTEDDEGDVGFAVWKYATDNTLRSEAVAKRGSTKNFSLDVSRLAGKYYIGYWVYEREYGSVNMTKLYLKV